MKHYDYVEWVLYKHNLLDDKIYQEMKEHLLLCDECMEVFLSLIDEEDMDRAGAFIPEDFTYKVMNNIKNITPMKKKVKRPARKMSNDFFIYYAAVASVAIILTATGFFGKIVDTVPQIASNISMEESRFKANTIYNFTEKITNNTSMFINNFNLNRNKED